MPIGWRGGGGGGKLLAAVQPFGSNGTTNHPQRERERVTGAVSQRVGNHDSCLYPDWSARGMRSNTCILIGQPRACAEVIVSWWLVMGMRIKNNYHLIGQPKSWQLYPDWSARGRRRSSCILIGQPGACVTTIYFWLVENKTDLPWLVNREHAQQQYISDWSKTR